MHFFVFSHLEIEILSFDNNKGHIWKRVRGNQRKEEKILDLTCILYVVFVRLRSFSPLLAIILDRPPEQEERCESPKKKTESELYMGSKEWLKVTGLS
jgi:hypothetical protein